MALYLAEPAQEHRRALKRLKREFRRKEHAFHIALYADNFYRKLLRKCMNFLTGRHLSEDFVTGTTYLLLEQGKAKILGYIDIRCQLNDFMLNNLGGHVGYAIAPSERRKGYATEMLRMGLEKCKEAGINPVLIPCLKSNIASARVIQKNGGVLEDERINDNGKVFQRYWITL